MSRPLARPPASAVPSVAIFLLALAAFGSGMSLRVMDPMLPRLAQEFSVPVGDAALTITTFAVAYGLSQLVFGPVGDRYGKYFVIACATLACALTSLLCALAPGYYGLLVARLLQGMTAAAVIPLAMAWLGDVIPYELRQPVLARFLIGQILGLSAGVMIGGLAADAHLWRLPFVLLAALFATAGWALLRQNRRLPPEVRATNRMQGPALARIVSEFRLVLARPWARLVLLAVFLEGVFLYGAFAFIATHLHHRHGVSLSVAGALVMLFGAGGFLFALASRHLVRRLRETGLVLYGGIVVAAALMAIGLAPSWWIAMPGCLCAGLGFYMVHNTLQLNATQMAPERRGAAVSAFASCFFLGQSTGVALAGMLVERIGTGYVLLLGSIGVLVVALAFFHRLTLNDKETQQHDAAPDPGTPPLDPKP